MRICCLHPNGIPYYLIFYFLDIGQNIPDSTTNSDGWNSFLDRISGITLSPEHFPTANGLWIRTKDPGISGSNPEKGILENQAELVRATSECEYVISDVRGHHVPFWARQMNSTIWKSLTVFVSSGGPKFRTQEPGS